MKKLVRGRSDKQTEEEKAGCGRPKGLNKQEEENVADEVARSSEVEAWGRVQRGFGKKRDRNSCEGRPNGLVGIYVLGEENLRLCKIVLHHRDTCSRDGYNDLIEI